MKHAVRGPPPPPRALVRNDNDHNDILSASEMKMKSKNPNSKQSLQGPHVLCVRFCLQENSLAHTSRNSQGQNNDKELQQLSLQETTTPGPGQSPRGEPEGVFRVTLLSHAGPINRLVLSGAPGSPKSISWWRGFHQGPESSVPQHGFRSLPI